MSQVVKSAVFLKSSSKVGECPAPDRPEYAFIGRSNVGKSSLINLIAGNNKLAKVSSKPGKTRLINHFLIDDSWYLVDLPGYGWAKASKTDKAKWQEMVEGYFGQRENLYCVFVLIDSRHDPMPIDINFVNSLGESGIPVALIFTKVDKQSANKGASNIARFKRALKSSWEEVPQGFATSTVSKTGHEDVIAYIRQINESVR